MARDFQFLSEDELAKEPSFRAWVLNPGSTENDFWNHYLEDFPEQAGKLFSAREIVLITLSLDVPSLEERRKLSMYDGLMRRIERHRRTHFLRRVGKWSAVAMIFMILSYTCFQFFSGSTGSPTRYEVPFGQRRVIYLPDQSKVELNANSVLTLSDKWDTGVREVWLEGEAYFEVEKRPVDNARFVVHTIGPDVVVLGTQFNVNTRNDFTSVFLEEGQVRLVLKKESHATGELLLSPGDLAQISPEGPQIFRKTAEEARSLTSWKSGYLVYNNASLYQVIKDIGTTYGKQVKLKNQALLSRKISGAIPTDDLDEFVKVTEILFGVKAAKEQDQIVFE